jgi:hypothetical protein
MKLTAKDVSIGLFAFSFGSDILHKKYLDDVLRKYATGSMIRAREKLTVDDAAKLRRIINSVL